MTLASLSRRLLPGILLSLVTASTAVAQGGINLSWIDCGAAGVQNRNFACDSNAGFDVLFASAIAPVDVPQLLGMEGVIDLMTSGATLSDWWQFGTGGCHSGAMSATFDFTAGPFSCIDPWSGQAVGGMDYQAGMGGPNRARIRAVCAIATSIAIDATDEYYFFRIVIRHVNSAGNGACAGCLDAACFALQQIQLVQPSGVGDYTISSPLIRNYVQWQGGVAVSLPSGSFPGCPLYPYDAAKRTTWGSVKSLYR